VICSQSGQQFDPRVVGAFAALDLDGLPGQPIVSTHGAAPPAA